MNKHLYVLFVNHSEECTFPISPYLQLVQFNIDLDGRQIFSAFLLSKISKDFLCICVWLYILHHFLNDSILVNDVGRSYNPHTDFSIIFLFLPNIKSLNCDSFWICNQNKWQFIFFCKFLV